MKRSSLRAADVFRGAMIGLTVRPVRAALSGLGIAIGVATIVAVLGITWSSQAQLLAQIDQLGTNLLVVSNGHTINGDETELPAAAAGSVARIDGVQSVAATAELNAVAVYRTDVVPPAHNGGLSVRAADAHVMDTLNATMAAGRFLDSAMASFPTTVLGAQAASQLGVDLSASTRVWLGGHWFTVVGILQPLPLAPEIDRSALIGFPVAAVLFGYDLRPSRIYLRASLDRVAAVHDLLGPSVDPVHPDQVASSRPSDALTLRAAAAGTLNGLFVGLGGVALLVGAIGIANVMVISVLERRTEIGLRRALGARRLHVAVQFLAEATMLAAVGAIAGLAIGVATTMAVARSNGWPAQLSVQVPLVALAAALAIGTLAGFYPAQRAARLSPTDALRAN